VRDADHKPEPDRGQDLEPVASAVALDPTTAQRGPRPPIRRGLPIDAYTQTRLVQLIRWIESDDQLRTEEELLTAAMNELGFKRQGKKIIAALRTAIRQARLQ